MNDEVQTASRRPLWRDRRLALLLLALAYFFVRGPLRAAELTVDLPTFYAGTRAWLAGENPYDLDTISRIYDQTGGDEQPVAFCISPPTTFPVMAPTAVFPYQIAKLLTIALNIASFGVAVWLVGRFAGLERRGAWLLFVAGTLALAPVHTSISQGQWCLPVLAALAGAMVCDFRRQDVAVGVLLALAAAVKPQMVLLFGPYYLIVGRWRVCLAGAAATAAIAAVGVLRLEAAGIDWWTGLTENMKAFTQAPVAELNGLPSGNYAALGNRRFIMVDLATLVHFFTHSDAVVAIVRVVASSLVLAVAALGTFRLPPGRDRVMWVYAVISVGCLLALYNRFYSAVLLVIVAGYGVRLLVGASKRQGVPLLVLVSPFLIPGVAVLLKSVRLEAAEQSILRSQFIQTVLFPHQVYLLILALALIGIAAVGVKEACRKKGC